MRSIKDEDKIEGMGKPRDKDRIEDEDEGKPKDKDKDKDKDEDKDRIEGKPSHKPASLQAQPCKPVPQRPFQ